MSSLENSKDNYKDVNQLMIKNFLSIEDEKKINKYQNSTSIINERTPLNNHSSNKKNFSNNLLYHKLTNKNYEKKL